MPLQDPEKLAWGSYWNWDPKETWAFITWTVFAIYLHIRTNKNLEGVNSASVSFWIETKDLNIRSQRIDLQHDFLLVLTKYCWDVAIFSTSCMCGGAIFM